MSSGKREGRKRETNLRVEATQESSAIEGNSHALAHHCPHMASVIILSCCILSLQKENRRKAEVRRGNRGKEKRGKKEPSIVIKIPPPWIPQLGMVVLLPSLPHSLILSSLILFSKNSTHCSHRCQSCQPQPPTVGRGTIRRPGIVGLIWETLGGAVRMM